MLETIKNLAVSLSGVIEKLIDSAKYALAFLYVKRATRIEEEKNAFKTSDAIKEKQLEIAAEPPASPVSVRDSMRDGRL